MKSSQSKSTSSSQSTGGASESSSTAGRSRDESSSSVGSAAHGSESYGASAGGDTSLTSASSAQGRDEFSNIRSQSEQGAYADERDVNARNQQASQSSPYSQSHYGQAQAQSPYGQQQDYSSYGASQQQQRQPQSQATFRRRSQQQQQQPNQFDQQSALAQRPSDLVAQSGLDAVMDAWAGLVLGQVQIATQAAIRMAQCWFSPSLLSGITEVQRRYAEDSIASATAAASRLAQFTPRAINQNQPFFAQGNQQQGSQQHVQNAPYGQQGAQEHQNQYGQQNPYNQQQDQQGQQNQQHQYGQQNYGQSSYASRQQQYA